MTRSTQLVKDEGIRTGSVLDPSRINGAFPTLSSSVTIAALTLWLDDGRGWFTSTG